MATGEGVGLADGDGPGIIEGKVDGEGLADCEASGVGFTSDAVDGVGETSVCAMFRGCFLIWVTTKPVAAMTRAAIKIIVRSMNPLKAREF